MRASGTPDIITYNTLASGFAQQGDAVRARAVIDKAVREGCEPDAKTYSPYLLALARRGEPAPVRACLAEMAGRGVKVNTFCIAALVQACVAAGDLAGAEEATEQLRERSPQRLLTPVIYNLLIQAHLAQGHSGEARVQELLAEMQRGGIPQGVDTSCLLMNAAAQSGEERAEQRVLTLLQRMRAQGLAPDAVQLSTMSKALVRAGRGREAVDLAHELEACPNAEYDQIAHNQLVWLYCWEGQMDEAEAATVRATQLAASAGLPAPVEAYGALIRGYYRLRQLPPLLVAFRRFMRLGGRPNRRMANAVVRLCLVNGETSTALQAIRAMKLLGVDMDTDQYRSWVMQVQRRQKSTQSQDGGEGSGSSSGGGSGDSGALAQSLERLKWFLGLPNSYYAADWR
jgi:pentatricopeptide repeat protein